MSSTTRRLDPVSAVALVVAMLALLASAAGVGYAAATVGTSDLKNKAVTAKKLKNNAVTTKKIKNNAVTGAKVKDGSLTGADLAPEAQATLATLLNGGEGDCAWQGLNVLVPGYGAGAPAFRKDRSGRVHLSGSAVGNNAAGGDGVCDSFDAGQLSDGIAFVLPAGFIPAKSLFELSPLTGTPFVVVGAGGITVPGFELPPGAVYADDGVVQLDSVSFDAADSGLANGRQQAKGQGPLLRGDSLRAGQGG